MGDTTKLKSFDEEFDEWLDEQGYESFEDLEDVSALEHRESGDEGEVVRNLGITPFVAVSGDGQRHIIRPKQGVSKRLFPGVAARLADYNRRFGVKPAKCECGAEAANMTGWHADYCPKYEVKS